MMRYAPYRESVVTCDGFFFKGDRGTDHPTVLDLLAAPPERYLRIAENRDAAEIRGKTLDEVGGAVAQ